jgi:N-ethylmaleimide reductase
MDEETIPTFEYIIKKLNDYNLAYIHLSEPRFSNTIRCY